MKRFRYSEWDGTQNIFEAEADALLQELERNLMSDGDLASHTNKLLENQDWRLGKIGRYAMPITSKQMAEEK